MMLSDPATPQTAWLTTVGWPAAAGLTGFLIAVIPGQLLGRRPTRRPHDDIGAYAAAPCRVTDGPPPASASVQDAHQVLQTVLLATAARMGLFLLAATGLALGLADSVRVVSVVAFSASFALGLVGETVAAVGRIRDRIGAPALRGQPPGPSADTPPGC